MNSVVQYVNISGCRVAAVIAAALLLPAGSPEGEQSARDWASLVGQRFRAERDIVYRTVDGIALKLDLYIPYKPAPGPAVLYIHGGGWQTGSKEQYVLWYLPYLQLGLPVVAVQYRLSSVAPAPAAVEDCRCAFRWVAKNGPKYGIDPQRIVITGGSAGGHLALLTAMLDSSFDGACENSGPAPAAAAIINYYGATDMEQLLRDGLDYLKRWFRGTPDPAALARHISPLTWVRPGLPPVLTLHGDADKSIPYDHATRLHKALDKAGVPNQVVTIHGGAHGRHTWSDADTIRVQRAIEDFLRKHKLIPA
jgi:acetyl esterase/lipase